MTLYDLSTYFLMRSQKIITKPTAYDVAIIDALKKYNVVNYGILEELINAGIPEFNTPFFQKELKAAKKLVKIYNQRPLMAPVFTFDSYQSSEFECALLNSVDRQTLATVLPFNNPVEFNRDLAFLLKDFNIFQVKQALSTFVSNQKLTMEVIEPTINRIKLMRIVKLIAFYEKQVLRIARQNSDVLSLQSNPFFYESEEKMEAIKAYLESIFTYLMNNGNNYIWGYLNAEQKEKLYDDVLHPRSKQELIVQKHFIQMISNYTILPELENEESRKRALNRFISQ